MTDHRRFDYAFAKAHGVQKKRPRTLPCLWCKERIKVKPQGRLPCYCGASCRQRAYEQSKWNPPHLVRLRRDLNSVAMRTAIREEVWALLRQAGLVSKDSVQPPMALRKSRPVLRVVPTDDNDSGDTQ
jgi:hypothetical protein